jgi:hypothetical protein
VTAVAATTKVACLAWCLLVASTRPYTEAHAVAWVDIALFFEDKLSTEQRDDLRAAFETTLRHESFAIDEVPDKGIVAFKRNGIAGEVVDELHIHETMIHISSNEYRGWTFTRDTAIKRLAPLLVRLADGRVKISGLGMAYQDIFLCDTPSDYDATDVFRAENRYLPTVVFEAGASWRQFLSWPTQESDDDPYTTHTSLTVKAKISSADSGNDEGSNEELHFTEITHRQSTPWNESVDSVVSWSESRFREILNNLHQRNKSLLLELLNEEMVDKIGLKE